MTIYKFSVPSLLQLASVEVGSLLLNQRFPPKRSRREVLPREFEKWNSLKDDISTVLESIPLPKALKSHIWDVVLRLYSQTWEWVDYCNSCAKIHDPKSNDKLVFHKLYFTGCGQINRTKMLQAYIEWLVEERAASNNSVDELFIRACDLCLEDCVAHIWQQMTADQRHHIISLNTGESLLAHWIYYLYPSKTNKLICWLPPWYNLALSMNDNYLYHALQTDNKMAAEYFWNRLNDAEKKGKAKLCAEFAVVHRMPNMLCSSLNYLDEEAYLLFLRQFSLRVLECLLDSVYDEFFMITVDKIWSFLDVRGYVRLLGIVIDKIPTSSEGSQRIQSILQEFWLKTPSSFKWQMLVDTEASLLLTLQMDVFRRTNKQNLESVYRIMCKGSSNIDWRHIMSCGKTFYSR